MADFQLDSRIPLLAQAGDPLAQGMRGLQMGQQIMQMPLQNQLLQQRAQQGQQAIAAEQARAAQGEKDRLLVSFAEGAQKLLPLIDSGDFTGAVEVLKERRINLLRANPNANVSDTELAIDALQSGDATQIQRVKTLSNSLITTAESRGLIKPKVGGAVSAEQRGFERLISGFSEEEQANARRVRAGLIAKAGSSADERAALNKELADQIVAFKAQKAEATAQGTAEGKAKGEFKTAPLVAKAKSQIAAAVKLATAEAASRGEALSDLRKAEAGLPGIKEVVGKLRELSSIATHTITGKAFNFLAKEFGFGATKGGTARAAYQATIDNQVLPLLKQTFGAAMTEGEGLRLTATLGDVEAPPEVKQAQLDAFLASQKRQIEILNREVAATANQGMVDNNDGTFTLPDGRIVRRK